LRILKEQDVSQSSIGLWSCRDIDPVEDTERYSIFTSNLSTPDVAGISIRLRILKAYAQAATGNRPASVAGISIRLRILKDVKMSTISAAIRSLQGYRSG